MTNIIEDSFQIALLLMRLVGLYHDGDKPILWKIWTCLTYSSAVLIILLTVVQFIVEENIDVHNRNQMCFLLAAVSGGCLKLIPFLLDPAAMKRCIELLGHENFHARNRHEETIIVERVNTCRFIAKIYFSTLFITVGLWVVLPLFENERRFPMNVWLPYGNSNTVLFYATYLYFTACCAYVGSVPFAVDPIVAGLAYHAAGQFKILQAQLKGIQQFANEFINFEQAAGILRDSVIRHDDILRFIEEFERCFTWCMAAEIAASIFSLCFCCVGLTTVSIATMEGMTYAQSYVMMALQILFYCHFGSLLFEENEQLITSIYMSPWYRYDVRIRRVLCIVMERAKVPVILTAGKLINLNLETFTLVMKRSYSLIAVMNQQ